MEPPDDGLNMCIRPNTLLIYVYFTSKLTAQTRIINHVFASLVIFRNKKRLLIPIIQ